MDSGRTILDFLKANNVNEEIAKYMLCQMAFETAVLGVPFESKVYRENNNVCGMKYAKQELAAGERNGYAYYNTINDSIKDLIKWYIRKRNAVLSTPLWIDSLAKYVRFLKNNKYFESEESKYLAGCEYFYKKYFNV